MVLVVSSRDSQVQFRFVFLLYNTVVLTSRLLVSQNLKAFLISCFSCQIQISHYLTTFPSGLNTVRQLSC